MDLLWFLQARVICNSYRALSSSVWGPQYLIHSPFSSIYFHWQPLERSLLGLIVWYSAALAFEFLKNINKKRNSFIFLSSEKHRKTAHYKKVMTVPTAVFCVLCFSANDIQSENI